MNFSQEQIDFMKQIGISIDFSSDLRDGDDELIEEKVSEYLQKNGFDSNYKPTAAGKMCESILDMI